MEEDIVGKSADTPSAWSGYLKGTICMKVLITDSLSVSFVIQADSYKVDWGDESYQEEKGKNSMDIMNFSEREVNNYGNVLKKYGIACCACEMKTKCTENVRRHVYRPYQRFASITITGENITELDISGNCIISLEIDSKTIEMLDCSYNRIKRLDLRKCSSLKILNCQHNLIRQIDLSKMFILETLCCNNNRLEELNLSSCTKLSKIDCSANLLNQLDVSDCEMLVDIDCSWNDILTEEMNYLFNTLPKYYLNIKLVKINCGFNPGFGKCNLQLLSKKNWHLE